MESSRNGSTSLNLDSAAFVAGHVHGNQNQYNHYYQSTIIHHPIIPTVNSAVGISSGEKKEEEQKNINAVPEDVNFELLFENLFCLLTHLVSIKNIDMAQQSYRQELSALCSKERILQKSDGEKVQSASVLSHFFPRDSLCDSPLTCVLYGDRPGAMQVIKSYYASYLQHYGDRYAVFYADDEVTLRSSYLQFAISHAKVVGLNGPEKKLSSIALLRSRLSFDSSLRKVLDYLSSQENYLIFYENLIEENYTSMRDSLLLKQGSGGYVDLFISSPSRYRDPPDHAQFRVLEMTLAERRALFYDYLSFNGSQAVEVPDAIFEVLGNDPIRIIKAAQFIRSPEEFATFLRIFHERTHSAVKENKNLVSPQQKIKQAVQRRKSTGSNKKELWEAIFSEYETVIFSQIIVELAQVTDCMELIGYSAYLDCHSIPVAYLKYLYGSNYKKRTFEEALSYLVELKLIKNIGLESVSLDFGLKCFLINLHRKTNLAIRSTYFKKLADFFEEKLREKCAFSFYNDREFFSNLKWFLQEFCNDKKEELKEKQVILYGSLVAYHLEVFDFKNALCFIQQVKNLLNKQPVKAVFIALEHHLEGRIIGSEAVLKEKKRLILQQLTQVSFEDFLEKSILQMILGCHAFLIEGDEKDAILNLDRGIAGLDQVADQSLFSSPTLFYESHLILLLEALRLGDDEKSKILLEKWIKKMEHFYGETFPPLVVSRIFLCVVKIKTGSKHPLEADISSGLEAITFLENTQSVIFKNLQETPYFQEAIAQAKMLFESRIQY
jgi:hypothetical protein